MLMECETQIKLKGHQSHQSTEDAHMMVFSRQQKDIQNKAQFFLCFSLFEVPQKQQQSTIDKMQKSWYLTNSSKL